MSAGSAEAGRCSTDVRIGINNGGGDVRGNRTCPGGYTQEDYWRWWCSLRHSDHAYVEDVTWVDFDAATHQEYIAEHPISLPVNLTPEQLAALADLTFGRRSCMLYTTRLSTIVYAVDTDGRSLEEIIEAAKARVEPPIPSITRLPSLDDGNAVVVQTPLWVWTTDPVTETAADGNAIRIEVTSHLQDMTFTLTGSDYSEQWTCDPTQVQVSGASLRGEQYLQPERYNACHMYIRRSSTGEPNNTFTLTATATWTFSYTLNGSPPFPIPGTVVRTNSYPVDAVEILVVND